MQNGTSKTEVPFAFQALTKQRHRLFEPAGRGQGETTNKRILFCLLFGKRQQLFGRRHELFEPAGFSRALTNRPQGGFVAGGTWARQSGRQVHPS